jgi:hypothetical protein
VKWGYRPRKPSWVWGIINLEDNFAGCREYVVNNYRIHFLRCNRVNGLGNASRIIVGVGKIAMRDHFSDGGSA